MQEKETGKIISNFSLRNRPYTGRGEKVDISIKIFPLGNATDQTLKLMIMIRRKNFGKVGKVFLYFVLIFQIFHQENKFSCKGLLRAWRQRIWYSISRNAQRRKAAKQKHKSMLG